MDIRKAEDILHTVRLTYDTEVPVWIRENYEGQPMTEPIAAIRAMMVMMEEMADRIDYLESGERRPTREEKHQRDLAYWSRRIAEDKMNASEGQINE